MAISANAVWECRGGTGSDLNGGGFVIGTGNIDYSQQDIPILTLKDLHAAQNSTTVTSLTSGFTAAMSGNVMQITSGANFVVGFYQIATFVNKATVTLDRAPATAGIGNAGGCYTGGALKTLPKLATAMNGVDSMKAYITGSFTTTGSITFNNSVGSGFRSRLIGYSSSRGDSGYASLTAITSASITCLLFTGNPGHNWSIENFVINCNSLSTSTGISFVTNCFTINCRVYNFTTFGITGTGGTNFVSDCEVSGGTSAATAAIQFTGGASIYTRNYVHDNACPGIVSETGASSNSDVTFNVCANNSGASSDGIRFSTADNVVNNTVHNSGRHGLNSTGNLNAQVSIRNNILTSNGGFGIVIGTSAMPALMEYDGNAFYNNTSGTRSNMDSLTGNFGVNPYTNVLDVILTALPYIGPTSGVLANFGLNSVAGGGAACRAAGTPKTWFNNASTSYLDMGAVQHKDSGTKYIIS